MSAKSSFAIHKALMGIGGEPKSVKKLRSGDLLIETSSAVQTKSFLYLPNLSSTLLHIVIRICEPPISVIDTAPITSNNLSISAASFSCTACPVLETTTTTSNTIPATAQDAIETLKPRRKKRPPKNTSNTIKPKIEIKMAPHKPRKSAPTEYTTDEEDIIVYDVEDQPEPNPKYVLNRDGYTYKGELVN
ncbi:hypothetical protein TNCV_3339611 [Trichonephila clavipes]|nr:hypothetical protein TNCV_3339611 [Trichonephila clavipes]